MIIIMPEFHKNLEFFRNSALTVMEDSGEHKNIINEALDALDEKRGLTTNPEYVITMPSFTVDSNIDGKQYFRKVRCTLGRNSSNSKYSTFNLYQNHFSTFEL